MKENLEKVIKEICGKHGNDRSKMMDIVSGVHSQLGHVPGEAMGLIAAECKAERIDVESVVSFYAFFSKEPKGRVVIRLCNDIVDQMYGVQRVAAAFKEELGIDFGQTTPDGKFSLEWAPCIGMCDQPPAAMIGDKIMTWLSSDSAREIVRTLKECGDPSKLKHTLGDGNNAHELVQSAVSNNLREKGAVVFAPMELGAGLAAALSVSPTDVIKKMISSRLRGRGGAGFPAGMKWEFTRNAAGDEKYILCNADEGEPGTFKDRVILTEAPNVLFEGMTIAGYAIGSKQGLLYLRGEYAYLRAFLENVLAERRKAGLLGKNIMGKGFDYDIRIQMGAGAYVCGEETALISSCEGLRGDPKNRPPFPAQKGYLGKPSCVNNVETYCAAARIMEKGDAWFAALGSQGSSGTKLLSISGDCKRPGVYELPFGVTLKDVLERVGAEECIAVQVGGPSGQLVSKADFGRKICYDDLATGGAIVVFGKGRDILEIAHNYMEFFCEESCGYCTPCRVGNELMKSRLERIMAGHGESSDLRYIEELGLTMKTMSRCGLGQTSANPVVTSLKNFRSEYEKRVIKREDGMQPSFDIHKALETSEGITGRKSVHFV
ncbi:MAG: NAD(P)H-dependent oxidoreductase subunit E [Myxococcota bacterium]|jgi:[NiFe] hydrogenase diaphorase moiety large subunit|nr:NAD(P)H-dependent oxidoreductase subunit E [Myxococcota bacterium]